MSRITYHPAPTLRAPLSVLRPWTPSLGLWGIGAGAAVLYLLSVTPRVKRDLLVPIPLLGSYYEDKTPASDKPF